MPEHVFRCVNVAAVSTPGQAADDKASIPTQVRENSEIIARMGWVEVAQVVIPGHSRNYWSMVELCADCPEYAELVRLIETEAVDLVVCWRWDRIWRNHWVGTDLERVMAQHQAQSYARLQGSMPTPPDQVRNWKLPGFKNIDQSIAQRASEDELDRLERRRYVGMGSGITDQGKHYCVQPPYGYQFDDERQLIPHPDEAQWVRWMFHQRLLNHTFRAIAADLTRRQVPPPSASPLRLRGGNGSFWHDNTVSKILRNDVVIGVSRWGQFENLDAHDPIVDADLFARVQAVPTVRYRQTMEHPERWLRGLIRCGYCHHAMLYRQNKYNTYMACSFYSRSRGSRCRHNGNNAGRVHDFVDEAIVHILSDQEAWLIARREQHNLPALAERIAGLERQMARNRLADQRAYDAFLADASDLGELRNTRDRLEREHASMSQDLAALMGLMDSAKGALVAFQEVAHIAEEFPTLPYEDKGRLAHLLISEVLLRKKEDPVIVWA